MAKKVNESKDKDANKTPSNKNSKLKDILTTMISPKDKNGREYVQTVILANDQGKPYAGLEREKNKIVDMPSKKMESICNLATHLWDSSKRTTQDLPDFAEVGSITVVLKSKKGSEPVLLTIIKDGDFFSITLAIDYKKV